ncbi:MAG: hypothetical protein FJZ00_05545 [Candidatus Sericytochromatia bacterium]|uniref:Uncharacterized protein n=1 Tax=Candidatus Tanganyikabacteria bacterium TaxID=2961651 RepID=A0A938BIR2_9BACT|nr:hypothetical protein [Candidatus Tanganyikabacteria bacterium]
MSGIGRIAPAGAPGQVSNPPRLATRPRRDGAAPGDELVLSAKAKQAAAAAPNQDPAAQGKPMPGTRTIQGPNFTATVAVAPESPKAVAPEFPKAVAPEFPKAVAPESPQAVAPEFPKAVAPESSRAAALEKPEGSGNPGVVPKPAELPKPAEPAMAAKAASGPRIPGLNVVAGIGDLTPALRWDTGAASAVKTGNNLGYVGLDYSRTFARPLNENTVLGLTVHPTLLRTLSNDEAGGATTAQVLTMGGIMKNHGPLSLSAGVGVMTDLMASSKPGVNTFTPMAAVGASYDAGSVAFEAQALAPLSQISDSWQLRTKVSFPRSRFLPDLAVVSAPWGIDRFEASKSFRLTDSLHATISVTENLAGPLGQHLSAGVGLTWKF